MSNRRAPFIWTPTQPIAGSVIGALNVNAPRGDGTNRWFLFRHVIDLDVVPAHAPADITVDGRYKLFVNTVAAGRGPVRCSPLAQRYDSYDLAPLLHAGRNVVALLVHTYGVDTAFHEEVRGLWRSVFGDGGLWIDGPVVNTRGAWKVMQTHAWEQDTPRANGSLGFIEWLDARELPADWAGLAFDDGGWDDARPMIAGGGGPEAPFGGIEMQPFPILMPRGIPALHETFVRARAIRWVKGQLAQPALPIYRRLYDETLVDLPAGAASAIEELLQSDNASATCRTTDGVDVAFTIDFGRILTGYPTIDFEARGGEMIELACSERLPNEWHAAVDPDARIVRSPLLGHDAHLIRYVAREGRQQAQRFEWCAIRYMHVVVRNAPDGITIRKLGAVATNYPVVERGRFQCSDPMLTKLWAAGAYTLRQCMHDAWEDCPSREQRQWLGDVTIENLAAWAAFGDSAAPLTAKYLIQAAESQRPDGLTQMFAPGDHQHDAILIPDWTLQWILCAADHWTLTADLATMDAIWPSIQKALTWFERVAGPDGTVTDMPYWHFMDWAGFGRQDEALALNAQLAGAYRAAAVIGHAVGSGRTATRYAERAATITAHLDDGHWDGDRGVWVDMVDRQTGNRKPRTSQHGVAALALWGDPDEARIARAFDWATDAARETATPAPPVVPFGDALDEQRGVVMANTFYGHFVCEALVRHGRATTALASIRRRFGRMIDAGSTTLWEAMTPWASLCHGFSASPTYFLSRHMLGVSPATPGFGKIVVRPDLMDLDFAEGIVPAGGHDIGIALRRTSSGFEAEITGGAAAIAVEAPVGFVLSREDRDEHRIRAVFDRRQGTATSPA